MKVRDFSSYNLTQKGKWYSFGYEIIRKSKQAVLITNVFLYLLSHRIALCNIYIAVYLYKYRLFYRQLFS